MGIWKAEHRIKYMCRELQRQTYSSPGYSQNMPLTESLPLGVILDSRCSLSSSFPLHFKTIPVRPRSLLTWLLQPWPNWYPAHAHVGLSGCYSRHGMPPNPKLSSGKQLLVLQCSAEGPSLPRNLPSPPKTKSGVSHVSLYAHYPSRHKPSP